MTKNYIGLPCDKLPTKLNLSEAPLVSTFQGYTASQFNFCKVEKPNRITKVTSVVENNSISATNTGKINN